MSKIECPDIDTLDNVEEIDKWIFKIQAEADDIKSQLESAKIDFHTTGERTDPIWFRNANYALRVRNRTVQALARRRGIVKRIGKTEQSKELSSHFMDVARETLDSETFNRILQSAHGRSMDDEE